MQLTRSHWRHLDYKNMLIITQILSKRWVFVDNLKNSQKYHLLVTSKQCSELKAKKWSKTLKRTRPSASTSRSLYQRKWLSLVLIWYWSAQKLKSEAHKVADHCNCRNKDSTGFLWSYLLVKRKSGRRPNFSTFLWNAKSSLGLIGKCSPDLQSTMGNKGHGRSTHWGKEWVSRALSLAAPARD